MEDHPKCSQMEKGYAGIYQDAGGRLFWSDEQHQADIRSLISERDKFREALFTLREQRLQEFEDDEIACRDKIIRDLSDEVVRLEKERSELSKLIFPSICYWGNISEAILGITFPNIRIGKCWFGHPILNPRKNQRFCSNKCRFKFHNNGRTDSTEEVQALRAGIKFTWDDMKE